MIKSVERKRQLVLGTVTVLTPLLLFPHLTLTQGIAQQNSVEQKPSSAKPAIQVNLHPLGVAPDLFTDQSDSKYEQRAVDTVFWLDNDTLAAAFSTTRRWTEKENPQPLNVRLVTFDRAGKQLFERNWTVGNDGPEAATSLQIAPGPDRSILAVHSSIQAGPNVNGIPEGDFIQVLNADTSLRQDFYVPASSAWVGNAISDSRLLLENFYADKHISLAWWSGNPLKLETQLDLPWAAEDTLAGPGVAARGMCECNSPQIGGVCLDRSRCNAIRVFRPNRPQQIILTPSPTFSPVPIGFLRPDALLVELRDSEGTAKSWFLARSDGVQTPLPSLPKSVEAAELTGVSADSERFSIDLGGETGLCGALNLYCKNYGRILVIDVTANRVVLEEPLSVYGGRSALSPDGKALAVFDKNKLAIYAVP